MMKENELTAPVLSDNYCVDVLWNGEPVESWDSNMIWCAPIGVHTFGSSSAIREWTETCKESASIITSQNQLKN